MRATGQSDSICLRIAHHLDLTESQIAGLTPICDFAKGRDRKLRAELPEKTIHVIRAIRRDTLNLILQISWYRVLWISAIHRLKASP